jgi:hypothetical protein
MTKSKGDKSNSLEINSRIEVEETEKQKSKVMTHYVEMSVEHDHTVNLYF